jgi:hypothetical protein
MELGEHMDSPSNFRISIEREWTLEDLYKFPRAFQQAYYFWDAISAEHDDDAAERIDRAFSILPWQGGYSAVVFFEQLKFSVPRRERPTITSIHYESPGWLELSLYITAALSLSRVVRSIALTIDQCNATYGNIYKGMQERKLLRISTERAAIKLETEQLQFIAVSARKLSQMLQFVSPEEITRKTKSTYSTLKILMAVYRRVRLLAEYQRRGKALFPDSSSVLVPPASSARERKAARKRIR